MEDVVGGGGGRGEGEEGGEVVRGVSMDGEGVCGEFIGEELPGGEEIGCNEAGLREACRDIARGEAVCDNAVMEKAANGEVG